MTKVHSWRFTFSYTDEDGKRKNGAYDGFPAADLDTEFAQWADAMHWTDVTIGSRKRVA
jgi:hypothetical protein